LANPGDTLASHLKKGQFRPAGGGKLPQHFTIEAVLGRVAKIPACFF
jgi:hypothetical protein